LPQIYADEVSWLIGSGAHRLSTHHLIISITRHTASVGAPHCDGERENEIVMFAGSGIEGQMTGSSEFNPKILQFPDEGFGFRELAQDLEPPLVQQGLQRETSVSFGTLQIGPAPVSVVPAVINTPNGEIPE
jgi:hypothetical protein